MRNLLFTLLVLFSVNSFAQVAVDTSATQKLPTLNQVDEKGKKHGPWIEKYKGAGKKYEGQFNHGVPYGEFKRYYKENGKIEAQLNYYPDGKKIAAYLYHANGKVMAQGIYSAKMEKDSLWKYYGRDGALVTEEFYRKGVKHGDWKTYFRNGQVSNLETYKDGKKDGPVKEWFENGQIKRDGMYVNDKPEGKFTTYNGDATIAAVGNFKAGVKDGEWNYNPGAVTGKGTQDGKSKEVYEKGNMVYTSIPRISYWDTNSTIVRSKETYNADYTTNYSHFYPSGTKQREGSFLRDKKVGLWNYYNEGGALDSTVNYTKGYKEGAFKWYDQGKISVGGAYHVNKFHGKYVEYYSDGKVKLEGEYYNGHKKGIWKSYNQEGQVIKEEKF